MQGMVQGICRVPPKGLRVIRRVVVFSDNTVGHYKVSNNNHNNHSTSDAANVNATTATTTTNKRCSK